MAERLTVTGVTKRYADTTALDDVSFEVPAGKFYALLGSSGSGKTTALRAVAGFVTPDSGEIRLGDTDLGPVPAHRRNVGIVFQNYALFQHLSVFENLAYGLKRRKVAKDELQERVLRMLEMLGIRDLGQRKPDQLSGGQQQRVALGRALVIEPSLLLLDEPLSALDRKIRQDLQQMLKEVQHETGVTTLMVTHDQEEALFLADELMVLEHGRVLQVGPPHEVYGRPQDAFVAQFMGDSNAWQGELEVAGDDARAKVAGISIPVAADRVPDGAGAGTSAALIVVRPEHIRLDESGSKVPGSVDAEVIEVNLAGPIARVRVRAAGGLEATALALAPTVQHLSAGDAVTFSIAPDTVQVYLTEDAGDSPAKQKAVEVGS